MKKIFMITGQVDLGIAGNQTLKNTIYYLTKDFKVNIFSGVPHNYPGVLDIGKVTQSFINVEYHRLPKSFNCLHKVVRSIKNLGRGVSDLPPPQESAEYFSDFNLSAQIIYLFSWLFYVAFETLRVFFAAVKDKPDIFYGYEIYGAEVASILGRIFKKPVVTRFQGTVLDIRKKSQWKYYPHQVLGLRAPAQAIIMGNDGTRGDEVLAHLGVERDRIYFWMNGLDQNIVGFVPNRQEIGRLKGELNLRNKKVLISVNRLAIWKRIDRIIYALDKLKSDDRMESVVLLIIGDGAERENLENLVNSYEISDSVIFVGAISHQDIGNYFSLADIFLITNDVSNLGNPLLEALYFGCPVVTLKDGSVDGILRDGENAILVPPERTEEELPRAIHRILTDRELAEKLRRNAKITAREKVISWQERMRKEAELMTNLIEGRR
jgi:glycosyltransferase involved in cell wall biosynthesis